MSKILFLSVLVAAPVFADDSQLLTQAMFDNSAKMTEIKTECNSRVTNVQTLQVSEGHYLHTFKLQRFFRGLPGRDCTVQIAQDLTPTYHDGPIEYVVSVIHE